MYIAEFLIARGRLRIAQGDVEAGVADLLWCGERLEALRVRWPSDWKAYAAPALAALGEKEAAARLAREQLAMARRVGAPGMLGRSLRAAAAAIGGDERLGAAAGGRVGARGAATRGSSWRTRSPISAPR